MAMSSKTAVHPEHKKGEKVAKKVKQKSAELCLGPQKSRSGTAHLQ